EAAYVFLLDPWWNPAAEDQAVDRAHRIGQERQVMVYRMIDEDTIEEQVLALQRRKAEPVDALNHGYEAFRSAVTAEDLRQPLSRAPGPPSRRLVPRCGLSESATRPPAGSRARASARPRARSRR